MTAIVVILLFLIPQMPAASIEGRVTPRGSEDAIGNASVLLTRVGGRVTDSIVVHTDSTGRFSVSNIPAGTYRLFAEHEDYLRAEFGQRQNGSAGTPITLMPGEMRDGIQMGLIRPGVITGRITDGAGEPARARVQALRRRYSDGKSILTVVAESPTNDLGEYRLYGLPPDNYVVGVTPYGYQRIQSDTYFSLRPLVVDALISLADSPQSMSQLTRQGAFIDSAAIRGEKVPDLYYPGVTEPENATSVAVQPGAVIARTDIQLSSRAQPRGPSVGVRGQIIDGTTGQPAGSASVQLGIPDRPFYLDSLFLIVSIQSEAHGEFVIDNVEPGDYVVLASTPNSISALAPVHVGVNGADGVRLVLNPSITLTGKISVEGDPSRVDFTKLKFTLVDGAVRRSIVPRADGSISAPNVWPGTYRIALTEAPANAYLKTVQSGNEVMADGIVRIVPRQQAIGLVVSTNTGTLEGVVLERDQIPAAAVRVVAIPEAAHRAHFEEYRAATSDGSGRFRIEGLAPGSYSVLSWEHIEENAWQVPEILRPYEEKARTVRIAEGETRTVELLVIP